MNWTEETFNFKARIIVTGVVLGLLFGVMVARAVDLMIIEGPRYRELARKQHMRVEKLVPPRGDIYDANGRVLAKSVNVHSLYAHPNKVPDPAAAATILAPILGDPEDQILEKLASGGKFIWVKRSLTPLQATAVRRSKLDGLVLISEYARYYPEGGLAAHVLGFSGNDGKGLEGIEHRYNAQLAGDESRFVVERDARGRSLYPDADEMPSSGGGHRVILTLDIRIQQIAEEALDMALSNSDATKGMAAVMEVSTGKILAMVVRPAFNPNTFGRSPAANYRNRFVTDIFEPGSTFKTFTMAALLDLGIGKMDDELFCEDGAFELDGSIINDTSPHSWFTMEEIIVHSSNIGAAKMGLKLGRDNFEDYLKRFGFGSETGIDLAGETNGIMHSFNKISRVGLANIAFGQGVGVTGVQLLAAFNAIANKGRWIRPHVVEKMIDYNGKTVYRNEESSRQVISAETAAAEKSVLVNVIYGGGTGRRAAPKGYTAAGKTGTAQKVDMEGGGYFEDRYLASFLGFVPANNPTISILVLVDDPQGDPWGGKVAGPAFAMIAERSLPILGVMPEGADRPLREIVAKLFKDRQQTGVPAHMEEVAIEVEQPGEENNNEDCAECMPDLVGLSLREILRTASEHGAKVEIMGSGRAVNQRPVSGSPVSEDNRWWVQLALEPN